MIDKNKHFNGEQIITLRLCFSAVWLNMVQVSLNNEMRTVFLREAFSLNFNKAFSLKLG